MKTFTDNTGRTWTLSVTVGTIKRVRALCGVDLANIITMESGKTPNVGLLERLAADPVLLVDVLFAVCKPEADAKGITDEEFGRAMAGDAIELAATALLDEIIDFFPEAKGVPEDPRCKPPLRGAKQAGADGTSRGSGIRRKNRSGPRSLDDLILRLAGIAGVNPDPLTLRELAALADARGRFEWEQTASLMALIVNLMRDPKKNKPVKAEDFNPYTVKEKAFLKAPLSVLRDVFVKK